MQPTVYINAPNHVTEKGSMGHYAAGLVRLFERDGWQVVFCASRPASIGTRAVSLPPALRTRINRLNMILLYLVMAWDMLGRDRRCFAIINISHEFIFPFFARRSLVVIHDTIQMEYPRSRAIKALLAVSWYLARRSAICVCVSEATRADVHRLGIAARVIRVPFEVATFERVRRAPIPASTPALDAIWCGTLAPHKNIDLFLELARRRPADAFGVIVPPNDATALATRHLPPNVACFSALAGDDYLMTIRRARMLVSTSLKEGYGMPPMEALMLGTPALVTDIPVYRELYATTATFFAPTIAALEAAYAVRVRVAVDAAALARSRGSFEEFLAPVRDLMSRCPVA